MPTEKRITKSPDKLTITTWPPFLKPRLLKSELSRTDGSEGSSRMIPDASEAIGKADGFGIGYRPDLGV